MTKGAADEHGAEPGPSNAAGLCDRTNQSESGGFDGQVVDHTQ